MKISTTRLSALKRPIKKVQNLLKDPLPRNKELVFEGYELSLPKIIYSFSVGKSRYTSTAFIELPQEELTRLTASEHHPLFVSLGMGFIPAHFLLSDFASVRINCAALSSNETRLLEAHFLEMLTEFRYLVGLDPSRPVKVISSGDFPLSPIPFPNAEEKALLMNGGGKDSCVSAELLKELGIPFAWLNGFPNEPRFRVIEASGNHENYGIRYFMDANVKRDAAYPWGVQPYVYAICACSLIVAYLKGFKYLVTGSEHSADDPNLIHKGVPVNHQAGKTSMFENFFNDFCQDSILQDAKLFSIARPYTDLRLAQMFSLSPQYFDAFFSCNVNMGTDKWCNSCHKCAFTYLSFYPFFETINLKEIFGAQLFDIPIIRQYMIELATATIKPWECVGTMEECKLALHYSLKKSPEMDFNQWPKRKDLEQACQDIDVDKAHTNTLAGFLMPHSIPDHLVEPLRIYSDQLLQKSVSQWPKVLPPAD